MLFSEIYDDIFTIRDISFSCDRLNGNISDSLPLHIYIYIVKQDYMETKFDMFS